MMRHVVVALSILMAAGVSHAGEPMTPEAVVAAAREGVTFVANDHITARQAANSELVLLDVRTEREFTMGRIPGATWMARGVVEFRLAAEIGFDLVDLKTGGGSDGNYTAAYAPTLDGLGVDGDGGHTLDERLYISSIVPRTLLLMRLMETLK